MLAADRGIACAVVDYDALRGIDDGAEHHGSSSPPGSSLVAVSRLERRGQVSRTRAVNCRC